jgi:hypothetical protein
MRDLIYFSKRRLGAFLPERPPRSWPATSVELNAQVVKIGLTTPLQAETAETDIKRLYRVTRYLEREATHFSAPDLTPGKWIYFDLEMGYGTSHRDSELPDLDDVVLFYGSLGGLESLTKSSVDLLLCGSTEHLLSKSASAGRMGSGTEWLYDLIFEIERTDSLGITNIPEALTSEALSVPRVNRPEAVARWVFDVIARHHSPKQRARLRGFARTNLVVPSTKLAPRLIVATPLFVEFASSKPKRLITGFRLHRNLCRRYGKPWWKWRPDLPPRDRDRVYDPARPSDQTARRDRARGNSEPG